jgi:hypothetical protein
MHLSKRVGVKRTDRVMEFEFRFTIDLRIPGQGDATQRIEIPVSVSSDAKTAEIIQPKIIEELIKPVKDLDRRSFVDLYQSLLAEQDRERRVGSKTISDILSCLSKFQAWLQIRAGSPIESPVKCLEDRVILKQYAEHIRSLPVGNSSSMCSKALAAIGKLSGACVREGLIRHKPDTVSRTSINIMRPRTEQQRRVKAVPVTVPELKAMLAVVDGCTWPRIGKVSPAKFWEANLLSHYVYGFRSQDWFSCRCTDKKGLLWSGIVTSSQCPILDDLHNEAGWAWYLVHKTSKKDEAAERPADVLVPLSSKMRELIEQFRGLDPDRVFPLRNNSSSYSIEFSRLLERAGLSDESRKAEGKPIIRLSLGQRNVASFRKGSSALWAKHVNRSASSYMLHHAVAEEGVAKMTTESYLQHEEILRDITAKIEHLPVWYT